MIIITIKEKLKENITKILFIKAKFLESQIKFLNLY